MEYTIVPRKHTQFGEFSFWMPNDGGYIYLQSKGQSGTQGRQICRGGGFMGDTLSARGEDQFYKICKNWYRQYMQNQAGCYL